MDERRLEGEEILGGNAGTDPAVVLVHALRGPQDFADNALKVPVCGARVLEAEVGFHAVKARGCVDDSEVAVD